MPRLLLILESLSVSVSVTNKSCALYKVNRKRGWRGRRGGRTETKGRQVHRKIPKLPAGKGRSVLFVVGPTPKVNGQKHLEKAQ